MAIVRAETTVQDALGRALAGAQVYWCNQPASTATNPPSPLANLYTDGTAVTPLVQPVLTNGFGYAFAYLDDSVLYTLIIWDSLFGSNPLVYPDQGYGSGGGGGSSLSPFSGVPIGTQDGTNTVFTLANGVLPLGVAPVYVEAWNNFPLIQGLGYSISGVTLTYARAPQPTDNIFAQGFILA